jgi:hypothetical protein
MNDPGKNEQIEDRAKTLFDDSVERLDAATLSRLNQGRQRALDELRRAENTVSWGRWLPAVGVAAVAVVTVLVMRGPVDVVDDPVTASDFEMLIEADSLEMFEDLEFPLMKKDPTRSSWSTSASGRSQMRTG